MSSSDAPAGAGRTHPPADWPAALASAGTRRWHTLAHAAVGLPPDSPSDTPDTARRVLALSDFIYRTLIKTPSLWADLSAAGDLETSRAPAEYADIVAAAVDPSRDEAALMKALRHCRRREMVRIAYRDLAGKAPLEATMAELSAFADACVRQTLPRLYRWQSDNTGTPRDADGASQPLVVVAMGKWGAGELNFSSDIDVILAYPSAGGTDGERPVTNEEFFTRLARQLIRVIGAATPQGIVFRVDPRLRPYGDNGPMVMSFDAMEDYYQIQGREWERYAWIKARPVTGLGGPAESLMARLRPFVYRRYLDYGAVESLREMKALISQEVKKKGMDRNVKLGAGGIREIEFFGQIFQLMRGGVVPALQIRPIQAVLSQLAALGYVPQAVVEELQSAYRFLRNTEHRLQMAADQQTHQLPDGDEPQGRLAVSMGYSDWAAFLAALNRHRTGVHGHFQQLLARDEDDDASEGALDAVWQMVASDHPPVEALAAAGYGDPEGILRRLALHLEDPRTRSLSREGRTRLDRLMPRLLKAAAEGQRPDVALIRVMDLLSAIQQRTNYLSLLIENTAVLTHLTRLAEISPWIVAFLARHPVLLDELLDPRTLYTPPRREEIEQELEQRLADIDPDDLEAQIEALCIFKNVNTLRVAAADITGALPLMRTSDHLTDIAQVVVERVMALSWRHMVAKYGRPAAGLEGSPHQMATGFAVIGFGKLGGIELGYGSDLDMVFLHAARAGDTAGAARSLDNAQFYARLGQRMIHILTAHTRAGRLYEVDMRLRPSGSGGVLVSHIDAYRHYQETDAWTWEHQALVRARPIAGDPDLVQRFSDIRHAVIARKRDPQTLRREVVDMRQKMRQEAFSPASDRFYIKQGNGGIVDIEFLVQYLVLRHADRYPELTRWSDNVRQMETLTKTAVLPLNTASFLKQAFLTYRAAVHRLNLEELPGEVPMARFDEISGRVSAIWRKVMLSDPA